jgi:hypothetical protein
VKDEEDRRRATRRLRQEPLPSEHPFWTTDGIIVLPHIGGPHPQRDRFVARLFVDNLGRFLDGAPLKEVVDRACRLLTATRPSAERSMRCRNLASARSSRWPS